jgi:hypothetical protein
MRTPLAILRMRVDTLPRNDVSTELRRSKTCAELQLLAMAELEGFVVDPNDRTDLGRICAEVAEALAAPQLTWPTMAQICAPCRITSGTAIQSTRRTTRAHQAPLRGTMAVATGQQGRRASRATLLPRSASEKARLTAQSVRQPELAAVVAWGHLGHSFGDVCREIPGTRGNLADDGARTRDLEILLRSAACHRPLL